VVATGAAAAGLDTGGGATLVAAGGLTGWVTADGGRSLIAGRVGVGCVIVTAGLGGV
jgi:hypothetical protein